MNDLKKSIQVEANIKLIEQNKENTEVEKNQPKKAVKRFYGFFIALLSAVFLALSSTLIKSVKIFTGSDQAIVRYVCQLLILIVIARLDKLNIFGKPEQRKLLLLRGFFGSLAFISFTFSVKLINPSDSAALLNTKIIVIAVLARIFLKEKFTLLHFLSLILTIFGVFLISQPSFLIKRFNSTSMILAQNSTNHTTRIYNDGEITSEIKLYIGILLGLTASFASSLVAIFLKKLTNNKVHYSTSILYTSYIGLPASFLISLIIHLFFKRAEKFSSYEDNYDLMWQIACSIVSGISGVLSQIALALSFKYDDTSYITIIRSTDLLFIFLLQYLFLTITPNIFSTTGAVLIFSSTILIILMKLIEQKLDKISSMSFLKKFIFFKF